MCTYRMCVPDPHHQELVSVFSHYSIQNHAAPGYQQAQGHTSGRSRDFHEPGSDTKVHHTLLLPNKTTQIEDTISDTLLQACFPIPNVTSEVFWKQCDEQKVEEPRANLKN